MLTEMRVPETPRKPKSPRKQRLLPRGFISIFLLAEASIPSFFPRPGVAPTRQRGHLKSPRFDVSSPSLRGSNKLTQIRGDKKRKEDWSHITGISKTHSDALSSMEVKQRGGVGWGGWGGVWHTLMRAGCCVCVWGGGGKRRRSPSFQSHVSVLGLQPAQRRHRCGGTTTSGHVSLTKHG